jgi:hypothetical protein
MSIPERKGEYDPRHSGGVCVLFVRNYSIRSNKRGLMLKSRAFISSTAREIRGSETGSTVTPRDNSSLDTRGSCPKDSR